jgi:LEA14-like dessication related protein
MVRDESIESNLSDTVLQYYYTMGMCMSKTGLFMNPTVKVSGAEVKSAGLSGVTLNVTLLASNPNPAALPATRILYELTKSSDGAMLAEGIFRQQVTLKASDTTRIKIPVTFKYWGLGAAGKSLVTRGKTSVLVKGEITFQAPMAPGGTATSLFQDEVELDMESLISTS